MRNHEVELVYFQLDACNLTPGKAQIVVNALEKVLARRTSLTADEVDYSTAQNRGTDAYMNWEGWKLLQNKEKIPNKPLAI